MTLHSVKVPVDTDILDQTLSLFGTVRNAQRLLRIEYIPYHVASQALQGNPVKEEYADAIVEAWRVWKQLYVRSIQNNATLDFILPYPIEEAYVAVEEMRAREAVQ